MTSASFHPLTLHTRDGVALAARAYDPVACRSGLAQGEALGRTPLAVLLVAAMGVPQRFYESFACWLAQHGVAVLSFDWRGTGDSAPARLRGYRASLTDWAEHDLPAAAQALFDRWPQAEPVYLGHSLGGQLFGWLERPERFARLVTVAAGNGYWRLNAPAVRRKAPWLWWLLAPVGIAMAGYFPGRRLGVVGDLPAGAMWQWRRWCLHPDYLGAEGPALRERYARVRVPIRAVLAEDDELVSPAGVHRLYQLYAEAPVRFEALQPQALGLKRIGHFGAFQLSAAPVLWPRLLQWLHGQAAA